MWLFFAAPKSFGFECCRRVWNRLIREWWRIHSFFAGSIWGASFQLNILQSKDESDEKRVIKIQKWSMALRYRLWKFIRSRSSWSLTIYIISILTTFNRLFIGHYINALHRRYMAACGLRCVSIRKQQQQQLHQLLYLPHLYRVFFFCYLVFGMLFEIKP